jgi:two-component system, OmpR family, sensor kinase
VSFRARLVLAAAYLLTAVVLALEIPLALNVDRRATSEFQSGVLGNAAILAARVSDLVAAANARDATPRPSAALESLVAGTPRTGSERILVVDGSGRLLADTVGRADVGTVYATGQRPELLAALGEGSIDSRSRFSDTLGEELLLVTVPVVDQAVVVGAVRVAASTAAVDASVRRSWLRLALIGLAVIGAGLALAWFLAGTVARPVSRLVAAANRLGQGDLDARAPGGGPRELDALAGAFNRMAGTLAANVAAQRDFVANASHQLRTPLTGLKLRLEAIRGAGGEVGEQAKKADLEVDRLGALVDDLLDLARGSSAEPTGRRVDLGEQAARAVERWRTPADQAGQTVRLEAAAAAVVWADPADVGHILDNLIENAVRYSPAGSDIVVEASSGQAGSSLTVSDRGPGIPAADRDRVFDRFYRGANGRRTGPGTGLGLAIVAELVGRWNGRVRIVEGPGTRIEASFPPPTVP